MKTHDMNDNISLWVPHSMAHYSFRNGLGLLFIEGPSSSNGQPSSLEDVGDSLQRLGFAMRFPSISL